VPVEAFKLTLESVRKFRGAFHPQGAAIIFREGKVESFDALFHAPALDVSVFVHVYKIPQITQNARDFFAIVQSIFVDEKKLFSLARILRSVLRKVLIFKHLQKTTGRPVASA
jgi:hypothetical protein